MCHNYILLDPVQLQCDLGPMVIVESQFHNRGAAEAVFLGLEMCEALAPIPVKHRDNKQQPRRVIEQLSTPIRPSANGALISH